LLWRKDWSSGTIRRKYSSRLSSARTYWREGGRKEGGREGGRDENEGEEEEGNPNDTLNIIYTHKPFFVQVQ